MLDVAIAGFALVVRIDGTHRLAAVRLDLETDGVSDGVRLC